MIPPAPWLWSAHIQRIAVRWYLHLTTIKKAHGAGARNSLNKRAPVEPRRDSPVDAKTAVEHVVGRTLAGLLAVRIVVAKLVPPRFEAFLKIHVIGVISQQLLSRAMPNPMRGRRLSRRRCRARILPATSTSVPPPLCRGRAVCIVFRGRVTHRRALGASTTPPKPSQPSAIRLSVVLVVITVIQPIADIARHVTSPRASAARASINVRVELSVWREAISHGDGAPTARTFDCCDALWRLSRWLARSLQPTHGVLAAAPPGGGSASCTARRCQRARGCRAIRKVHLRSFKRSDLAPAHHFLALGGLRAAR